MGGAGARGGRARGDRGRSQLRADVWRAPSPAQDRSARRGGPGRGESARLVSRGASDVGGAAGDAPAFCAARRQLVEMRRARSRCCGRWCDKTAIACPSCGAERVPARLAQLALPAPLAATVAPLSRMIETTDAGDCRARSSSCGSRPRAIPSSRRLQTVPGVGLIVALTFRAQLDDRRALHACGPGQCGARAWCRARTARPSGGIGGTSPRPVHGNCAACWCRRRGRVGAVNRARRLRAWVERLAARRGRRIAVVALARRLSRILYALWRDRGDV